MEFYKVIQNDQNQILRMTAMVAEWVKTLVLQIQVASVLFRVFIRSSIKSLAVNVTSNQEISLWILMFYDFGNYFNATKSFDA